MTLRVNLIDKYHPKCLPLKRMIDNPNGPSDSTRRQFLFFPNRHILEPGLDAPIILQANPKNAFQTVFRQLLALHEVHPVLIEPAAIGGGSILFGCQQFILACNQLVGARNGMEILGVTAKLLESCRELSGNLESFYVFEQCSLEVDKSDKGREEPFEAGPIRSQFKNYGALLEDFALDPPCAISIDVERLGKLQISLEETYDQACLQLERFFQASIASPKPEPLVDFCHGLYAEVGKGLIPDHILVSEEAEKEEGRVGLLNLIPDLEDGVKQNLK